MLTPDEYSPEQFWRAQPRSHKLGLIHPGSTLSSSLCHAATLWQRHFMICGPKTDSREISAAGTGLVGAIVKPSEFLPKVSSFRAQRFC